MISNRGCIETRLSLAAPSPRSYGLGITAETGGRLVSHDGPEDAHPISAGLLPATPAMPSVPSSELHSGSPFLLLEYSSRNNLGWENSRKAGPRFVIARTSRFGRINVAEGFPMTEQGWASAWRALSDLDAGAAAAAATTLEKRAARVQAAAALAALDAESLCSLRLVPFNGGSGDVPLSKGQFYDLRFLGDRILVSAPRSPDPLVEMGYEDVETVEISGSSPGRSAGEVIALTLALTLLGALLGLLLLGLVGLLLGAVIFGMVGAMVASASSQNETIIRIRGSDSELYFRHTAKRPDALRIELSEPLLAIENARPGQPGDAGERAVAASGSIPDQLSKLASLLREGLITRDECDGLKTELITKPQGP